MIPVQGALFRREKGANSNKEREIVLIGSYREEGRATLLFLEKKDHDI